jgi:hypothetical protein
LGAVTSGIVAFHFAIETTCSGEDIPQKFRRGASIRCQECFGRQHGTRHEVVASEVAASTLAASGSLAVEGESHCTPCQLPEK